MALSYLRCVFINSCLNVHSTTCYAVKSSVEVCTPKCFEVDIDFHRLLCNPYSQQQAATPRPFSLNQQHFTSSRTVVTTVSGYLRYYA